MKRETQHRQPLVSTLSFPRNISRKQTERLLLLYTEPIPMDMLSGYHGRHICGATLLSAPPSKTIIVSAAHCNYICKSSEGKVRETCCCRNPADNFASCRTVTIHFLSYSFLTIIFQSSSYCGPDAELRLAEASDLSLVCREWNIGEEPELYSQEVEVVLPIKKIINHPSYSSNGPGGGYSISVYFVDDTKLKEDGVVKEGLIYPACLPTDGDISQGKKGIFESWKDPAPLCLYVYYSFDFDRTVQIYLNDELVLRHTRMDTVECKDPGWMGSNTFYPKGVLCDVTLHVRVAWMPRR